MAKAFDISKFRKSITKSIDGLGVGFNDPTDWISTGNYALNYLISGDFFKGVPLGKVTVFAGESGAGKSYICSGNIIKAAQEQGIYVVLVDSENALDEKWLLDLGVDTSEDKLLKLNMAMIDDVAKTISEFMKEYKTMAEDVRPKVLFVIDSLGMLLTPTDVNQFEAGEMKGDMGQDPAFTSLITVNKLLWQINNKVRGASISRLQTTLEYKVLFQDQTNLVYQTTPRTMATVQPRRQTLCFVTMPADCLKFTQATPIVWNVTTSTKTWTWTRRSMPVWTSLLSFLHNYQKQTAHRLM